LKPSTMPGPSAANLSSLPAGNSYPAQQAYVAQPAGGNSTKAEGDAAAAPGAGYVIAGQNVSQNNANMAGAGVAGAVLGGTAAYLAGNGSVGQIGQGISNGASGVANGVSGGVEGVQDQHAKVKTAIRNKIHHLITGTVVLIVLGAVLLGMGKSTIFEPDAVTTFVPATDFEAVQCKVIEVDNAEQTVATRYKTDDWELAPKCGIPTTCDGKKCQDTFRFKFQVVGTVASADDILRFAQTRGIAQGNVNAAQKTVDDEVLVQTTACSPDNTTQDCEFANKYVEQATANLAVHQASLASLPATAEPDSYWSSMETLERIPFESCAATNVPKIEMGGLYEGLGGVGVVVGDTKECWKPVGPVNALNEAYDCSMNAECIRFLSDPNADTAPVTTSTLETTAKVLRIIGTILIPVGFLFPCLAVLCCMIKKPIRMRQNPPGAQLANPYSEGGGGGLGRFGFGI